MPTACSSPVEVPKSGWKGPHHSPLGGSWYSEGVFDSDLTMPKSRPVQVRVFFCPMWGFMVGFPVVVGSRVVGYALCGL